jgi:glycerophosphoryl diester phosphodiesterase
MPYSTLPLAHLYEGRTLNVAHRGAREIAPENTLAAFYAAAELGADGVEFDVQLTADGFPVVFHDRALERVTDGTGPLFEQPLAALRELDAGTHFNPAFAGERIPTLDEALDACSAHFALNIELKIHKRGIGERAWLAAEVLRRIAHHGAMGRVILSSFDPLALRAVRRLSADAATGYLTPPDLPALLAWAGRVTAGRHEAEHPHYTTVDRRTIRWARARGRRVNVWTVNEADAIRRMRDLGVDMIITDRPDLARSILHGER